MKKTLALVLSLVMCVGILAGCGGEKIMEGSLYNPDLKIGDAGGLKLPISGSNAKIVWSVESSYPEVKDSLVVKTLREATGIDLELMVLSTASAGEKIKVLAAANDLPDIVGEGLEPEFSNDLAVQGAFAAVEDYVDILPNFKRTFVDNEENNWIFKTHAAGDGKLYGFFGWDWNRDINHGMLYRKDIFDKHGLKLWNSPETFYETLKKLKELYPNSTPFVNKNTDQIFNRLSTSWGIIAQNPYYDEDAKVWKYSDTDPKYKELLDFLQKLYNEGLVDPEFITATQAQWSSKMTQADKAFVTFDWIGRLEQFTEQAAGTVPGYDLRFAPPVGPTQTYPTPSQLCWSRHVSSKSKYIEECFKLLDFCISPAGREIISMGVEGVSYNLNANGKAEYVGFEGQIPGQTELEEKYGLYIQGMYLGFDRRSSYFQFTEREQEAQDFVKDGANQHPIDPQLSFTTEETKIKNDKLINLQKAGLEFSTKYVLSNGGEKEWNEWLATAERLGYKDIVKVYNDAQARFDAK